MTDDDSFHSDSSAESRLAAVTQHDLVQKYFPWVDDRQKVLIAVISLLCVSAATMLVVGYTTGAFVDSFEHPPGTNESGVTDKDMMVSQHSAAMTGDDYRIAVNLDYTRGNSSQQATRIYRYNATTNRIIGNITSPQGSYTMYDTPNQSTYYRLVGYGQANSSEVQYRKSSRGSALFTAREFFSQRLPYFAIEAQGYTTLEDGTEVRKFNITGFDANTSQINASQYAVNGSFTLAEDGTIRTYDATIRTTTGNQTFVQRESVTVSRQTVTLEDPSWLDTAINKTTANKTAE